MITGFDKVGQARFQPCMGIAVIPLAGGLFDGPVHAFDLAVGSGRVHLFQPVFDLMRRAHTVEDVFEGKPVPLAMGELDVVVGQDRVAPVPRRRGRDQMTQELGGNPLYRALMQFDTGELGGRVEGDKQPDFAFVGADFSDVNMKTAARVRRAGSWRCREEPVL